MLSFVDEQLLKNPQANFLFTRYLQVTSEADNLPFCEKLFRLRRESWEILEKLKALAEELK